MNRVIASFCIALAIGCLVVGGTAPDTITKTGGLMIAIVNIFWALEHLKAYFREDR